MQIRAPTVSRTGGFREPIATLLADGKTVGRHYSGPKAGTFKSAPYSADYVFLRKG
jgi:hypothetical protein